MILVLSLATHILKLEQQRLAWPLHKDEAQIHKMLKKKRENDTREKFGYIQKNEEDQKW